MNDVKAEGGARQVLDGPPSGYFLVVPQGQEQEAVSLAAVLATVVDSWRLIAAAVLIGAMGALAVTLFMPTIYRAKIIVAPVTESESVGGHGLGGMLGGEIGGLASMAGIDISGGDARKQEFYATLMSVGFAREFIQSENLMPVLFADRWDARTGNWRQGVRIPTLGAGVRMLAGHYRTISEDRKTSLVTVSFECTSPELAARLANRTIEMVNDRLRNEAIKTADLSIEYLDKELAKTNVVGVQQGIYQLIQEQINKSMVANVQREYAYKVIDPAVVPDIKASPLRALIGSIGAIAGLVLSLSWVLLRRSERAARA
ncbi:MAG TPA: Wzz/FepE/Etk N-terminal domain-containing protein [Steroidobacteraceae bacterium]|jgi:hypothetical protein|nr:Wzz/FepE/Etk N-terminal domain-containing protein [Steroidobacteraceae bacterium]